MVPPEVQFGYEEFLEFAAQCQIRSGTRLIPFTPLFAYQEAIALLADHYPGFIIVKDRQLGITELITCWMLARSRNSAYAGAVFSITEKDAGKVSARVNRMPKGIPGFEWAVDSVGTRRPIGGGDMIFRPSTQNATRGLESIWDLFFDEAGFVSIVSEMYAASVPSQEMVGEAARTFIVSTIPAVGEKCWFWEQVLANNPDDININELLALARSGGYLNRTKIDLPKIPGFIAFEDESGWVKLMIGHKAHPKYGADPDYVEKVRRTKKLTVEQANREYNLTLPSLRADNPAINYFDEHRHVQPIDIDPDLNLYVSFDFNRHPATCLLGNKIGDNLVFCEEFYLLNSETFALSKAVCDRIERINPPRIFVTGDASGKSDTANSKKSNWDIVSDEFKDRGLLFMRKWPEGNPSVATTINGLNFLFMEDRAIVSTRCPELIKDLKQVEDDGKGGLNKKKDLMRTHTLDCARYLSHLVFPYKSGPDLDWMLDR